MRSLSLLPASLFLAIVAVACGSSSDQPAEQISASGGSTAGGKAGSAGGGAAGARAGSGGAGTAGTGGNGTAGSSAGAAGSAGNGAAGNETAGAGGASTAGAGGASTAGAGGTSAGAAGTTSSGGSGGACPSPVTAPVVPDTCSNDDDCTLGTALSECCGPVAYAVPNTSLAAWNTAAEPYNACKCPQKPACAADGTAAEDGTTPYIPNALKEPVAKCRKGVCVATYESCKALPDVPRACAAPSDCESIAVAPTCCAREARGISKDARPGFEQQMSTYLAACQDCSLVKCPMPLPTADDGTKATSADQLPSVTCAAALCVTSFGK